MTIQKLHRCRTCAFWTPYKGLSKAGECNPPEDFTGVTEHQDSCSLWKNNKENKNEK